MDILLYQGPEPLYKTRTPRMPLWESGICLDFEYRPSEGCRCTEKAAYCSPITIKQEKLEKYLISSNRSGIRRFVLWKEKHVIHRIVFLLNRENRTQMYFHSIINIDDLSINILFINFYSSKNTKKKYREKFDYRSIIISLCSPTRTLDSPTLPFQSTTLLHIYIDLYFFFGTLHQIPLVDSIE